MTAITQPDYTSPYVDSAPPRPQGSRLLRLPAPAEPAGRRRLFVALALAAAVGFFLLVHAYFAPGPGNPGIDENAYLVAGKNFANHFTTGMRPSTPYAYVGPMWIRTDDGWYYPKYPLGVPLLNAVAIWATGGTSNEAAFYVSPVCGALAVLAMFFLTRALAGSFFALLGAVLLATNPTLLHLSLTPSSHAPDICFALWGMVAALHWWRTGRTWAGIAGGLLLGFTVSIRYTEGLLVLPLAFAVAMTIRWRDWRTYVRAAVPVIAWAVPVAALAAYNLASSGHLTGYDSTNESIGFSWRDLQNKWQYTIQQLHLYGLFFVFPLGILGMLLMLARGWWRVGVLMLLWFVPSVLLYMAYYWGQQMPGIAYL